MRITSTTLHKYFLPLGFAIIIALMISTTLATAYRISDSGNITINSQIESHNIHQLLDIMSSATLERSHKLIILIQSRDNFHIGSTAFHLKNESHKFNEARNTYLSYDPSEEILKLLDYQASLTAKNVQKIKEIVIYLKSKDYNMANHLMYKQVLPRNKYILGLIEKFDKLANNNALTKLENTKKISEDTFKNTLVINVISILLTLFLMIYIHRKQKENENALSILATTDTLTNLPNRKSFIKSINSKIVNARKNNSLFSIIFLDIDHFKSINDIYGHEVGDHVLNLFASTIKNKIQSDDILARFGGDEFVLLLRNTNKSNDFLNIVKRLTIALDTSYLIDNNELFITASIGASIYPHDGTTTTELLNNADTAMYSAKQSGRNCYQYFSLEDSQKIEYEHMVSHALQIILEHDNKNKELSLVYQPLVNFDDNNFNECEALIRWKDTNGNLVNTGEFIAIAEKSNLIQKVNMFVIKEACKQQSIWNKQGINDVRININLSGNKRIFDELFKCLLEQIEHFKLDPKLFGIELTERTMYEVSEDTSKNLDYFRKLGMKISIDDFGTGYSSLSYLKDLPITSLKIDKSFVDDLPNERVDMALVNAIITLAHSLDLDVVAEGIETQEQYDYLKECKCNIAQGYLLHRPMNSNQLSRLKLVA